MSISLPNGTLLAAPSTSTAHYTAAVTKILHLANFSAELKTRDLQLIFKDYENEKGGFRIKWVNDNNALAVFFDAPTAKKAYLRMLLNPPANFGGSIKPYDQPDAAQIVATLSARSIGHRGSNSTARQSFSVPQSDGAGFGGGATGHARRSSMTTAQGAMSGGLPGGAFGGFSMPKRPSVSGISGSRPPGMGHASSASIGGNGTGSMGPPSLPSHNRTGSLSRQPLTGVLSFNSNTAQTGITNTNGGLAAAAANRAKLATHPESTATSRSASSSDTEPIVVINEAPPGHWSNDARSPSAGQASGGRASFSVRRDSMSAEKALREVEKALASVEART